MLVVGVALVLATFGIAKAQPSTVITQALATATTSVAYLTASTTGQTYQFDSVLFSSGKVANLTTVDATDLYLQVAASSTLTIYSITPQFSNNGIDWYGFNQAIGTQTSTGTSTLATSSLVYEWRPGTTATTSNVFNLPYAPAIHQRVIVQTMNGNGSLYLEADLKKNPSTP